MAAPAGEIRSVYRNTGLLPQQGSDFKWPLAVALVAIAGIGVVFWGIQQLRWHWANEWAPKKEAASHISLIENYLSQDEIAGAGSNDLALKHVSTMKVSSGAFKRIREHFEQKSRRPAAVLDGRSLMYLAILTNLDRKISPSDPSRDKVD